MTRMTRMTKQTDVCPFCIVISGVHELGCEYYKVPLSKIIPAIVGTIILCPIAIIAGGTIGLVAGISYALSKMYNKLL